MTTDVNPARDEILDRVRAALGRRPGEPALPVLPTARVPARVPGNTNDEIAMVLDEIGKLGGRTRRLDRVGFEEALGELIQVEMIRKATLWETTELQALGVSDILAGLGVEIVSSQAGKDALARCDLGVTGVDMVLPETGTLVLRASPERSRAVSLLPRVHLALVRPANLRADLEIVLREMRTAPYFVFVTGPSRTADIELTVTIGVHGPQVLYVWTLE